MTHLAAVCAARNAFMDVSLQATPFDQAAEHVKNILAMEHEVRAQMTYA